MKTKFGWVSPIHWLILLIFLCVLASLFFVVTRSIAYRHAYARGYEAGRQSQIAPHAPLAGGRKLF